MNVLNNSLATNKHHITDAASLGEKTSGSNMAAARGRHCLR